MIALEPPYRHARADDADALAFLVNEAGEGMPLALWRDLASPGQSPWTVGAERARRDAGAFSYRNAVVRERGDAVAACLVGYPLPDLPPVTDYSTLRPMLAPLQALEDLAGGSWYVNVLATRPQWRGTGCGSGLLEVAFAQARATGRRCASIIVSNANAGARRLYERHGFRERARRPMNKEGWNGDGESWLLLLSDL